MKQRGVLASMAAALVGLISRIKLFIIRHKTPSRREVRRHGPGRAKKPAYIGRPGAKLWHRLTVGHSHAACLSDRQTRRWCKTGYWCNPRAEHAKKAQPDRVEIIGDVRRATMRQPA
jgi:hypothetical protein